eukprot:14216140-Alexandrium_andersonii.AAC.1
MIATYCERERQREAEDRRRHSEVMPHAQRGLVPGWELDEVSEEGLRSVMGLRAEAEMGDRD